MNLFTSFQDAPIKRKLLLIWLLTSGLALLSVSIILSAKGWIEWRERVVSDMGTYARVIGANAASAMLFDNRDAAAETLSALSANPNIVDAVIYDKAGKEFARFIVPPHSAGVYMPSIKPGSYLFSLNQLVLSEPIQFKGEVLGTLYLESDLRGLYVEILSSTALILIAVLGVLLASIFLFARLQKNIVDPIQDLSDVMGKVSVDQNYGIRVDVHGKDEIGMLAHTFNGMLERIQQAQEELVRKEKLAVLGQVAGSVGHELRNPLGVMSNAVYFLQTVLSEADETTKEYLNIIKGEIASSERIVSDLLDSVRTKPPHAGIVGVMELINQTLRKLTLPPSVSVKLDIPETLPPLRADAQQIHQVFRNLISNGAEAMPEGGVLEICAVENKQDKNITISVRDNGSGMTPEHLSKLFQPLFTTKARGIGLGLVVVKNLTQANGGTVKVASEAGKGATFFVTLPSDSSTIESA